METIFLEVKGMTCGACVKRVNQALQAVDGVLEVEVHLTTGRVQVKGNFDSGSAPLLESLAVAGYLAKEKGASPGFTSNKSSGCRTGTGTSGSCCCP